MSDIYPFCKQQANFIYSEKFTYPPVTW